MVRLSKKQAKESEESFKAMKELISKEEVDLKNEKLFKDSKKSLATEVVETRKTLGLNQYHLAELSGKSQGAIARLETMKSNPTLKGISEIAGAMNKKVNIVFEDIE